MKLKMRVILLVFVLIFNTNTVNAMEQDEWIDERWMDEFEYLDIAVSDEGMYVVVGIDGRTLYSDNGIDWVYNKLSVNDTLFAVAYGNGRFCAVTGEHDVLISEDGINWEVVHSIHSDDIRNVTFDGKEFLLMTSESTASGDTAYNHYFYTSDDGITWSYASRFYGSSHYGEYMSDLKYCNGIYIAGFNYDELFVVSKDKKNWVTIGFDKDAAIRDVTYDGEFYIISAYDYEDDKKVSKVYKSKDLYEWIEIDTGVDRVGNFEKIEKYKDYYIGFFRDEESTTVLKSKDLLQWKVIGEIDDSIFRIKSVVHENEYKAIALNSIMSIENNRVSSITNPAFMPIDISSMGDKLIVADWYNGLYVKEQDQAWSHLDYFQGKRIHGLEVIDDTAYVLYQAKDNETEEVELYKSKDLETWTLLSTFDVDYFVELYSVNDRLYLSLGFTGLYTTVNGQDWFKCNISESISTIALCNGHYYMVTRSGELFSSYDCINWQLDSELGTWIDASASNSQSIMYVVDEYLYYSEDMKNWNSYFIGDITITSMLWNSDKYILVSNSDTIISTTDGSDLEVSTKDYFVGNRYTYWTGKQCVLAGNYYLATYEPKDFIKVIVRDEPVIFDYAPVIVNGRTMIPARAVFEKIGADVSWESDTRSVVIEKDGKKIILSIGNNVATSNGESKILDSAPEIINGRTVVPIRFIAEELGMEVTWIDESKTILLD